MKKNLLFITIVIAIIVSVFVLSYSSSDDNKNAGYSASDMDYSDSSSNPVEFGTITKLYDEEKYKDITPAAEMTVSIDGKEISGKFAHIYDRPKNYYPNYMYNAEDHSGFSVDEEGKIVWCFFSGIEADTEKILTDDEYISIAKNFVEKIRGDVKIDWTTFKVDVKKDKGIKGYYTISFDKYLNGCKTAESFLVKLTYDGKVQTFSSDMLGRIPEDLDVTDYDIKAVEAEVYKRLDDIYSGMSKETRDMYVIEYNLPEPTISLTADGTPCFIYYAIVRFTPVDGSLGHEDLVPVFVTPK